MPAHVPDNDIPQLWNENSQRTWSGLFKVLESHLNKAQGIENETVEMLFPVVKQLEQSGTPYPQTQSELKDILNRHMAQRYAA